MLSLEAGRYEYGLGAGAVLRSFPPLSFSYYSQVNAQHETFKIANIHHLQLQGRQNATIEESLFVLKKNINIIPNILL